MSFFSRSSSRSNPYRHGKHGSQHYQRRGGLLGKLFQAMHSGSHSRRPQRPNSNPYAYEPEPSQNHYSNPNQNEVTSCRRCHSQIPAGSKFCLECGEKVITECLHCGKKLPANSKFCLECGSKQI